MQNFVLLIWLTLCAAQDARERRIANGLTLGAGALALAWLLWSGTTWLGASAEQGGWAVLLALAFTLPGYAMRRLGAGDVKLMAALGLATDGRHVLGVFIGAGLASVCWLLLAPRVWLHIGQGLRGHLRYLEPGMSKKQPFAPFLWVGLMLTLAVFGFCTESESATTFIQ
ncbi:prepilin peptidase [Pseudomonas sp. PD9R]|uniref:prepilin peptidase n=1 Tax=Pseudomonas sp. PD9R TaxID=2853534 RepID=UPI001C46468A|nr:prepilin peptidase [Pseudomonas sp. PD9R]MBV6826193.1 prepilin peptidase [Pseudomonas sp. PD9R]